MTCKVCKKFDECMAEADFLWQVFAPNYDGEHYCGEFSAYTNADRIRAMSDEELAKFLGRVKDPCDYCQLADVDGACTETLCDDAMMEWLQQPVKEE